MYSGPCSSSAVLTSGPSATGVSQTGSFFDPDRCASQMSFPPAVPGRLLWMKSRWPSGEIPGAPSMNGVLTGGPRLTGGSHGLEAEARLVIQMSTSPRPPGRFDAKYIVSSSAVMAGLLSFADELTTGPRFTGADHSAPADELTFGVTAPRKASVGVSLPHASSSVTARSPLIRAERIVTSCEWRRIYQSPTGASRTPGG